MAQYTVKPGDSPASVAGAMYGDQRRYIDLINANGGSWHPGDVIDIPDVTGTPSPVITQAQFASAPIGYQNGQAQYRGQPSTPTVPAFSKPTVPAFGTSGAHGTADQGQGSRWAALPPAVTPPAYAPQTLRVPNSVKYPAQVGTGVGPGAMPYGQAGAGIPASGYGRTLALDMAPGARRKSGGPMSGGPMGGGAGVAAGQNIPNPLGFGNPADRALFGNQFMAEGMGMGPAVPGSAAGSPANAAGPAANDYGAGYAALANAMKGSLYQQYENGAPGAPTTVAPEMANIVYAARYSTAAIYAYGGLYGPAWKGNRQSLPVVIYPTVANEIPIPAGYKDTPSFMAALGYVVDTSGNYVRKDPMVSQGYGGGNFGTSTSIPSSYTPYSYGGYNYGYGAGSGSAAQAPGGMGMGLVAWRVTA